MRYKPNSPVVCQVELKSNGRKRILMGEASPDSQISEEIFTIITYLHVDNTYALAIPDDYTGWNIGSFHIVHQDVDPKWNGKKFYDISEEFILQEETEVVQERYRRLALEAKRAK